MASRRPGLRRGGLLEPDEARVIAENLAETDQARRRRLHRGGCHAVGRDPLPRRRGGEVVGVLGRTEAGHELRVRPRRGRIGAGSRTARSANFGAVEGDTPTSSTCACSAPGHHPEQPRVFERTLSGGARLLEFPTVEAGSTMSLASSLCGRDRSFHRLHRKRRRIPRIDPRLLSNDGRGVCNRGLTRRRRKARAGRPVSPGSSLPPEPS